MGLIGGIARTAVIAGTATAVSNRVSRRQANRWAAQEQQAAPPEPPPSPPPQEPAAATGADPIEQLQRLGDLHASGVLTDAEFQAQKQRILAA